MKKDGDAEESCALPRVIDQKVGTVGLSKTPCPKSVLATTCLVFCEMISLIYDCCSDARERGQAAAGPGQEIMPIKLARR